MMQFVFENTPLIFLTASFWRDEAFSFLMARLPLFQLLATTAHDANPPLYYIVLKIWIAAFGSSELALRTPSLLFYWATLYVGFLFMRDIFTFSQKKSLLYLVLFLLNPVLHYYAFEARMYTMMAFLGTLLMYLFLRHRYYAYMLTLIVSLYTHYFLYLIPILHLGIVLFTASKKERSDWIYTWKIALCTAFPWVLFVLISRPPLSKSFWIPYSTIQQIVNIPITLISGYEKGTGMTFPYIEVFGIIFWTFLIAGIWFFFGKHKTYLKGENMRTLTLLIAWAIGIPLLVYLLSYVKPIFLPRYLIYSAVGLLLFSVLIIDSQKKNVRYMFFILFCFLSLSAAFVQIKTRIKAPLRTTYGQIMREMKKGDIVYVTNELDYHPAQYYLQDKYPVYIYKKTYEELPWFVGKVLIAPTAVTNYLPNFPKRAFIVLSDGTYTIQARQ